MIKILLVEFVDKPGNPSVEREVLYFENYDTESVVSPVNAKVFNELLIESQYDDSERAFLINGFTHGFSLGYAAKNKVQCTAPNLKLRIRDEVDLWNKVMKEVHENDTLVLSKIYHLRTIISSCPLVLSQRTMGRTPDSFFTCRIHAPRTALQLMLIPQRSFVQLNTQILVML